MLRELQILTESDEPFTSKDIQHNLSAFNMHDRTIRRALNKEGVKYLHLRKKGILYKDDLVKRLRFARKCKRILPENFWKAGLSMFLDGVGFEYKRNPCKSAKSSKTMGWRRRNQGLDINFTAKGKKEGKKQARFYVGISYQKGVVMCKPYTGSLNAERYCKIIIPRIEDGVQCSNNPVGKRILQDNCPIMNAKSVVDALSNIGIMRFKIPARSPDINCIETVFFAVRKKIQQDAVDRNIQNESFKQFQLRAASVIRQFSVTYIDKVIDSMWKRIDLVIKRNGQRIKY